MMLVYCDPAARSIARPRPGVEEALLEERRLAARLHAGNDHELHGARVDDSTCIALASTMPGPAPRRPAHVADRPSFLSGFLSNLDNLDVVKGTRMSEETLWASWNVAALASPIGSREGIRGTSIATGLSLPSRGPCGGVYSDQDHPGDGAGRLAAGTPPSSGLSP